MAVSRKGFAREILAPASLAPAGPAAASPAPSSQDGPGQAFRPAPLEPPQEAPKAASAALEAPAPGLPASPEGQPASARLLEAKAYGSSAARLQQAPGPATGLARAAQIRLLPVILGLAMTPEGLRRMDSPRLTVRLDPPGPGQPGPWALPALAAAAADGLDLARAAADLSGDGGACAELLGLFPAGGSDVLAIGYLVLADRLGAGPESGSGYWTEVRPDWAGGRILFPGEKRLEPVKLSPVVEARGRLRLPGYKVAASPLAQGHAEALLAALARLREDLESGDLVYNLLPEAFTLGHLQRVCEIVSGEPFLAPAFRRKAAPRLTATSDFSREKRFRPPRLFKYNPGWRSGRPRG